MLVRRSSRSQKVDVAISHSQLRVNSVYKNLQRPNCAYCTSFKAVVKLQRNYDMHLITYTFIKCRSEVRVRYFSLFIKDASSYAVKKITEISQVQRASAQACRLLKIIQQRLYIAFPKFNTFLLLYNCELCLLKRYRFLFNSINIYFTIDVIYPFICNPYFLVYTFFKIQFDRKNAVFEISNADLFIIILKIANEAQKPKNMRSLGFFYSSRLIVLYIKLLSYAMHLLLCMFFNRYFFYCFNNVATSFKRVNWFIEFDLQGCHKKENC